MENPHKIIHAAEEKATLLKRALPQFLDRYGKSKVTPLVRFYPGKMGMRAILEEILTEARREAKNLWSFSSVDDLFSLIGEEFYDFVQRRVADGIPSKVIALDSEKARERVRLASQELRQVKLISPDRFLHHGLIFTWGKKIAMMSLKKELNLLVIESEELAQTQQRMFEVLWESLPPTT